MGDNNHFGSYEEDNYNQTNNNQLHGRSENDVMPIMNNVPKNSRNPHIRTAHSEKPNKRNKNDFTLKNPLNNGA